MRVLLIAVAAAFMAADAEPGKVVRRTFDFGGIERSYFLYEPQSSRTAGKRPLIVTLHGSRGDADMLVNAWKDIADREGVVLMGPASLSGRGWGPVDDPSEFFAALVDEAVDTHNVDERRVYLFGFSAGGHYALSLAVLQPEFFAAAGVYAGVLAPELNGIAETAERRIPIVLAGGRRDAIVPPPYMEDTRNRLNTWGWRVPLHMLNNDHNYRVIAGDVNKRAWDVFKDARLDGAPKLKRYRLQLLAQRNPH